MRSIFLSSAYEVENTLNCSSLDILVLFTVSSCVYFSVGKAPQHVIPTLNITALLLSTIFIDKPLYSVTRYRSLSITLLQKP
jgi:hypothetical protein